MGLWQSTPLIADHCTRCACSDCSVIKGKLIAWGADVFANAKGPNAHGLLLRLTLAGLIAAHGWSRFITAGVIPFGEWLDSQGIPFGLAIAIAVTCIEIVGSILLAIRRYVIPLCAIYVAIYLTGIVLVHAPVGWFVVGHGRNGSEYSVLLIVCLTCVGLMERNHSR